ncbi:insulin-like peptide INSL5 [Scophthalmus maximus]|uniref:insulin-like peptide INSL5 n=1 Tax=Scophthalmus maximus TaxID=52904 RepID=UPI0015E0ADF2|nr:insulin-like peptide INSL5 [Scophthalmus maximus]
MPKLPVSLLVVLAAAVCVIHAQERFKICGRDLIRLAISTCGSSRLRRSVLDVEPGQHQVTPLWDHDASTEELWATETDEGNKDVFSVAPHQYPLSSRIRRASGRISDICCHKGCSMRELIQFC